MLFSEHSRERSEKGAYECFLIPLAGLNAVDLCLTNCTWAEQYSEDLYPLDAGIDSGATYTVKSLTLLTFSMTASLAVFVGEPTANRSTGEDSCHQRQSVVVVIVSRSHECVLLIECR